VELLDEVGLSRPTLAKNIEEMCEKKLVLKDPKGYTIGPYIPIIRTGEMVVAEIGEYEPEIKQCYFPVDSWEPREMWEDARRRNLSDSKFLERFILRVGFSAIYPIIHALLSHDEAEMKRWISKGFEPLPFLWFETLLVKLVGENLIKRVRQIGLEEDRWLTPFELLKLAQGMGLQVRMDEFLRMLNNTYPAEFMYLNRAAEKHSWNQRWGAGVIHLTKESIKA